MANVSMGGFRVWGTVSGGEGSGPSPFVQEVANNYNTAIGIGDIVTQLSDGTLARSVAGDANKFIGVVTGISYVPGGIVPGRALNNYLPANTTFTPTTVGSANASLVMFVPLTSDVILEVDGNAAAPTPTAAGVIGLIGENCDISVGSGADSVTGVSSMTLDLSTHNTTTKNFRIVGIKNYTLQGGFSTVDNDPTLTRFKFLVVVNQGLWPSYTESGQ